MIFFHLPGVTLGTGKPMRRREFIAFVGSSAAVWPLPLTAQPAIKRPHVGILWPGSPPDKWDSAFREGLHTLGYVEGRNILLEYRWAEGHQERFPHSPAFENPVRTI